MVMPITADEDLMPSQIDAAAIDARMFDLTAVSDTFRQDPFPAYETLRQQAPVHRQPDGSYFLTRYADNVLVYKDPKLFSSDKHIEFTPKFGDSPLLLHHTTSLIFNDPPLHTRVRRIMTGALTPRAVADLEGPVRDLVDGLLEEMAARTRRGVDVDLIDDFAAAIPIEVIGNLLAVPRDERGPLRDWSLAILGALEPKPTPDMIADGNRAVTEFTAYLAGLVAIRRKTPGDPERDVLTRLIQGEVAGERLTESELLQNVIFILNAGHETTTNLIGNALYALDKWPDQRTKLMAQPNLINSAVEEFLRYDSPVQLGSRITTAATDVLGVHMAAGTRITIGIGAANFDPAEFKEPERLDIARAPNRHLAFAHGVHTCVGLAVARLEGRVAIQRFLARYPNYKIGAAGRAPLRGGRIRFRGFISLPVTLG
jgi:cytochrome P450